MNILQISKPLPPTDSDESDELSFPITIADEMREVSEAADFVERLLTDGAASIVYGPSNLGKSFWVLDVAACVATGRDFRDELETEQGAVVYVALEGELGIRNRIVALRQSGKLPDGSPLFLCFAAVSLLEPGHAEKLAASVRAAAMQSKLPCRLVVIDTLSRAMAGGDENGSKDMTVAVQSIDAIKAATGAHVLTIHHCGKDEAKGARGHSSLRAAVDTEIELTRPEGQSITTVRVTKQRDMPTGEAMPFSLKVVELGTDRRGNPITSCTVHHEDEMMAAEVKKAGRKSIYQAEDLLAYLPTNNVSEWQKRARDECGMAKDTFYRLKKELEADCRTKKDPATQAIIKA